MTSILMEIDPDNNMATKKTYIYSNGEILAQHTGGYDAPIYYYMHDRLGSVRQIIDPNGKVVNRYMYQPFGAIHLFEQDVVIDNSFKFTGQYYDSEIDQYYLRARQYYPRIQRFTARDPVAGKFDEPMSLHVYLYCQNEPVNRIDPSGLWWEITHRKFGMWGWGSDENRGIAPFDYARLDRDRPAVQNRPPYFTDYTGLHFRSRCDVYPELLYAASLGDTLGFEYSMHEWQDSYVHYDRGFRWPWTLGHGPHDVISGISADDPTDPVNIRNRAYERCDYTTRELEKIWFKYNIGYTNGLEDFMSNPEAELPESNPWLSIWPDSPLIDY